MVICLQIPTTFEIGGRIQGLQTPNLDVVSAIGTHFENPFTCTKKISCKNCRISGLCPLFGILNTRKDSVLETVSEYLTPISEPFRFYSQ
jgi:hypothetical protein